VTVDYDRRWTRRREVYWSEHERRCARCGSTDDVQLHHSSYRWPLGEEPDEALVPLCRPCHRRVHELARRWPWIGLEAVTRWSVRLGGLRTLLTL
jgi:5-methylcytosine-specific restriction endonuclease McrA